MPNIYAGTSDGRITSPTTTWAGARDAATGAAVTSAENASSHFTAVSRFGSRGGGNTYRVVRTFLYFNTNGINEPVVDVILNIHGYTGYDGSIWGVKGGLQNAMGLQVEQFDDIPGYQTGTLMFGNVTQYTSIGIISGGTWDTSGYNKLQGTSALMSDMENESTVTVVLTDYNYDARNMAPTSNATYNIGGYYANNTGTSKDPFLEYKIAGYGHEVNTVAAASIGKFNTVEAANIGKIITVD
jgi:hypothetical protein